MATGIDIDYNRIARDYDANRGYPANAAAQIGPALAARCGSGATILEIGIGSGRVARPLVDSGLLVMGVDTARGMLEVARERGITWLVQADGAQLPFAEASFDAVLAVQVLHHIADWRLALAETLRVLRPGGRILFGSDQRDPEAHSEQLRRQMRSIIGELAPQARPPATGAPLAHELERLGAELEPDLIAAEWVQIVRPSEVLDRLARRNDLFSWALDDALLATAVERTRAWAATWGDLATPEAVWHRLTLQVAVRPEHIH
jgi:SAM-dependent methyltransferase